MLISRLVLAFYRTKLVVEQLLFSQIYHIAIRLHSKNQFKYSLLTILTSKTSYKSTCLLMLRGNDSFDHIYACLSIIYYYLQLKLIKFVKSVLKQNLRINIIPTSPNRIFSFYIQNIRIVSA